MRKPIVLRSLLLMAAVGCGGSTRSTPPDLATVDLLSARRSFPRLVPHSDAVLKPLRLVTVVAANDLLSASLLTFSDHLVASSWWSAAVQLFGLGAATSVHASGPAITGDFTQAQMIAYLQAAIANGAPAPDGTNCYLLYLPDNVHISGPLPFDAYHAPFPSPGATLGDGFAVVSRGTPFGGGESQLQELTRAASHEVLEAASDPTWRSWSLDAPPTNPTTGSVWQVAQIPGPIESADLCEGSRTFENGDEYQRYFTNAAAQAGGDPCVPATTEAYYNSTAAQDWFAAPAGQSTLVPFTGWSTQTVPDWLTIAVVVEATGGWSSLLGKLLPISSALGQELPACLGEGMNSGVAGNIAVTAPATVKSGDFIVIQIQSFRDDPQTCYPPATGDQFHFWLVGAYAP